MSIIEIKIVSPEIVAALNNLADALRGQGEIVPRTSSAGPVKTENKAEAKPSARKPTKPAAEEKTADDAGDAEPVKVSKPSSTSQSEKQTEVEDDDLSGTTDEGETISAEALGKAITDAVAAGHRPTVVKILGSFNAKRGGDVAEEDRADCFAQISDLTKEG